MFGGGLFESRVRAMLPPVFTLVFWSPGSASVLRHLLCSHLQRVHAGPPWGSQLRLPPGCPPGLAGTHHPAAG